MSIYNDYSEIIKKGHIYTFLDGYLNDNWGSNPKEHIALLKKLFKEEDKYALMVKSLTNWELVPHKNGSGDRYWLNSSTRVSTWDVPQEIEAMFPKLEIINIVPRKENNYKELTKIYSMKNKSTPTVFDFSSQHHAIISILYVTNENSYMMIINSGYGIENHNKINESGEDLYNLWQCYKLNVDFDFTLFDILLFFKIKKFYRVLIKNSPEEQFLGFINKFIDENYTRDDPEIGPFFDSDDEGKKEKITENKYYFKFIYSFLDKNSKKISTLELSRAIDPTFDEDIFENFVKKWEELKEEEEEVKRYSLIRNRQFNYQEGNLYTNPQKSGSCAWFSVLWFKLYSSLLPSFNKIEINFCDEYKNLLDAFYNDLLENIGNVLTFNEKTVSYVQSLLTHLYIEEGDLQNNRWAFNFYKPSVNNDKEVNMLSHSFVSAKKIESDKYKGIYQVFSSKKRSTKDHIDCYVNSCILKKIYQEIGDGIGYWNEPFDENLFPREKESIIRLNMENNKLKLNKLDFFYLLKAVYKINKELITEIEKGEISNIESASFLILDIIIKWLKKEDSFKKSLLRCSFYSLCEEKMIIDSKQADWLNIVELPITCILEFSEIVLGNIKNIRLKKEKELYIGSDSSQDFFELMAKNFIYIDNKKIFLKKLTEKLEQIKKKEEDNSKIIRINRNLRAISFLEKGLIPSNISELSILSFPLDYPVLIAEMGGATKENITGKYDPNLDVNNNYLTKDNSRDLLDNVYTDKSSIVYETKGITYEAIMGLDTGKNHYNSGFWASNNEGYLFIPNKKEFCLLIKNCNVQGSEKFFLNDWEVITHPTSKEYPFMSLIPYNTPYFICHKNQLDFKVWIFCVILREEKKPKSEYALGSFIDNNHIEEKWICFNVSTNMLTFKFNKQGEDLYNYLKNTYERNGGTKFLRVFLNINVTSFEVLEDSYPADNKFIPENYNADISIERLLEESSLDQNCIPFDSLNEEITLKIDEELSGSLYIVCKQVIQDLFNSYYEDDISEEEKKNFVENFQDASEGKSIEEFFENTKICHFNSDIKAKVDIKAKANIEKIKIDLLGYRSQKISELDNVSNTLGFRNLTNEQISIFLHILIVNQLLKDLLEAEKISNECEKPDCKPDCRKLRQIMIFKQEQGILSFPKTEGKKFELLFQILFGHIIRPEQWDYYQENILSSYRAQDEKFSHVHQIMMGKGKSSVIAPLLVLFFRSENKKPKLIVPQTLLNQTQGDHFELSMYFDIQEPYIFTDSDIKSELLSPENNLDDDDVYIYDEFDSLYDPLQSNYNVVIDSSDELLFSKDQINFIVDFVTTAGDVVVSNDTITDSFKEHIQLLLKDVHTFKSNSDYGMSKKEVFKRLVIPYKRKDTPIEGSNFSSEVITVALTALYFWKSSSEFLFEIPDILILIKTQLSELIEMMNIPRMINNQLKDLQKQINLADKESQLSEDCLRILREFDILEYFRKSNYNLEETRGLIKSYINSINFIRKTKAIKNISFIDVIGNRKMSFQTGFTGTVNLDLLEVDYKKIDDGTLKRFGVIHKDFDEKINVYSAFMGYLKASENNLFDAQDFNDLLEKIELKHNMLIDAIGLLRDYSNLEIIKEIATKFRNEKPNRKYVYLNDKDDKMIYDGSVPYPYTVYLEDAFYFYSQRNIVGIDFQQPMDMIGILLVNESLDYTNMAQAIYRARKLNNGHVMDICDCTKKSPLENDEESKDEIPKTRTERLLELYKLMLKNDKQKLESRKNLLYSQTIKHVARTERIGEFVDFPYTESNLEPHYEVPDLDIVERYQANSKYSPESNYNLHGPNYKTLLDDLYKRIGEQDVLKNLDLGISGGLDVTQQINNQTEINIQTEVEKNFRTTIDHHYHYLNDLYQEQIFTPEQTIDDIIEDTIPLSISTGNQQLVVSYNAFDSKSDEFRIIIMSNDENEIWILSNSTYCNKMLRLGPQLDLSGILYNKNLFPNYEPKIPDEFYPIFFMRPKQGLPITKKFFELVNYLSNQLQIPLPENFIDVPNSGDNEGLLMYKNKQIKDHTNKCYFMHEIFGEPTKYSTFNKPFIMYKKKDLYNEHTVSSRELEAEPINKIFREKANNEDGLLEIDSPVILKEKAELDSQTASGLNKSGKKKEKTQNKTRTFIFNRQGIKKRSRKVKKLRSNRKTKKK